MIFVATGNYMGFPRLVKAIDELKARGVIADEVLMQIGNTPDPNSPHCKTVRFLPRIEFERTIQEAMVVVSHGGAGTLIDAFKAGKTPVVVPRRKKYGEHVDDHQLEVAEALGREGRVIVAREVEDLPAALAKARHCASQATLSEPRRMIELVAQAIEELASHSST